MIKKEIDVNQEIKKLEKRYENISIPRLLVSQNYEELYRTNSLEKNKQEIDRLFESWKGMKIIKAYYQNGIQSLIEKYGQDINTVITENKSELSKSIRQFKSNLYLEYYYNEKAVDFILKPSIKYLLEKQYEIDKTISKIRREIKA